ncbi:hypothetical protein CTI12_AA567040 [Artemisia annua]|uniref:RING-type domain-containing protein n=1 Tax=Artemisia annua TaxID=35608 RepID=A0A2U1KT90_ARTAN|nr:hypothetical protein CTI12_AA567040 [Artemisia annua]
MGQTWEPSPLDKPGCPICMKQLNEEMATQCGHMYHDDCISVALAIKKQILFKNLDVDMKEVTPSSHLKNKVRIVEGNPNFFKNKKDKVNSNSTVRFVVNQVKSPVVAAGHTHMPPAAVNADQLYIPTVMLGEDEKKATLGSPNQLLPAQGPQVAQFPHAIPSRAPIILDLELFSLNMFFRSVLLMAMEMALEELVSSFVKRSVCLQKLVQ